MVSLYFVLGPGQSYAIYYVGGVEDEIHGQTDGTETTFPNYGHSEIQNAKNLTYTVSNL